MYLIKFNMNIIAIVIRSMSMTVSVTIPMTIPFFIVDYYNEY